MDLTYGSLATPECALDQSANGARVDVELDSGFFQGQTVEPDKDERCFAVIRQSIQSLRHSAQLPLHVDSVLRRSKIVLGASTAASASGRLRVPPSLPLLVAILAAVRNKHACG